MSAKKSLYEILELPQTASYDDIRAAHQRLLQTLEKQQAILGRDDYNLKLRLLQVAYTTLSAPTSRDAYDAGLSTRIPAPAQPALALVPQTPTVAVNAEAAALRADAMMLRAEAMALRADAMGMKAAVHSSFPMSAMDPPLKAAGRGVLSSFRSILMGLGTLVAVSLVLKLVAVFWMGRAPEEDSAARRKAEDKIYLQEYYQTHGVRPASRAEADLMDAENRRKQDEQRAVRAAEDAKRKSADAERRFEDESRRRGEQVAAELQFAEQRASLARMEDERQREQDRRRDADAERRRLDAEQERWQRVLNRPPTRY